MFGLRMERKTNAGKANTMTTNRPPQTLAARLPARAAELIRREARRMVGRGEARHVGDAYGEMMARGVCKRAGEGGEE
jgi:hypothetical protein